MRLNVAVTLLSLFIVSGHVVELPDALQSSPHPPKVESPLGVATRVIDSSRLVVALQLLDSGEHESPPPETVPVPVPDLVTERSGGSSTLMARLAVFHASPVFDEPFAAREAPESVRKPVVGGAVQLKTHSMQSWPLGVPPLGHKVEKLLGVVWMSSPNDTVVWLSAVDSVPPGPVTSSPPRTLLDADASTVMRSR